jgi:hypothetical protein
VVVPVRADGEDALPAQRAEAALGVGRPRRIADQGREIAPDRFGKGPRDGLEPLRQLVEHHRGVAVEALHPALEMLVGDRLRLQVASLEVRERGVHAGGGPAERLHRRQ